MNCVRFEVWSFKSLSQMLFFFFSLDPQEIVRRLKCVHQRGTNFNLIFHEKKPTSDWCLPLGFFKANDEIKQGWKLEFPVPFSQK